MAKFKVGDKVKVIRCSCYTECIGKTGRIEQIDGDNFSLDTTHFHTKDEVELVEEDCKSCEVNSDNVGEMLSRAKEVLKNGYMGELEGFEYYKDNEPSNSSRNKVGGIMSKISSFVKNSLLSAEEKLLRKYDLKDSCGDYTSEARELVLAKMVKDNEAYLIEVATAMEAEEKKNK